MAKIHEIRGGNGDGKLFVFHCPGCRYDHPFHTGGITANHPQWQWNGDLERPTFTPSLVVFKDDPARRCHSFVTNGSIQFLSDSHHDLKGMTVEIPEYES